MTHRLFIAIDVPAADILPLQTQLDRLKLPIDWESPEKLHITLNFLGRVPEETIPELRNLIARAVAQFGPLNISFPFLETLYQRHEGTLIYLAVACEELTQLQKALSEGLSSMSLPQPRRFLPHITIGRFKKADPTLTKSFISQISDFSYTPIPPITANYVTLYESHLTKAGSHFQKLSKSFFYTT